MRYCKQDTHQLTIHIANEFSLSVIGDLSGWSLSMHKLYVCATLTQQLINSCYLQNVPNGNFVKFFLQSVQWESKNLVFVLVIISNVPSITDRLFFITITPPSAWFIYATE